MSFERLAVYVLAIAGHFALVIAATNRLMGLRLTCPQLWIVSRCHTLALIVVPLLLFQELVRLGGSPSDWWMLSPAWSAYFTVCVGALVAWVAEIVRRASLRPPQSLVSNHSATMDVAAALGFRPVGYGRHRWLTRLPGNEQFKVQFSDKRVQLPRLPAAWNGLSLLHLTDLHFAGVVDRPFFVKVIEKSQAPEPDLVLFTGDLLDSLDRLDWLPDTLGRLRARYGCYFVLGNHDWFLEPPAIRRQLEELGWTDLAGRCIAISIGDQRLALAGTEVPWMGEHPDLAPRDRCPFSVLLSHTPDNLPWARQQEFDLMLAGHVHGGQIRLPGVGPIYAPSRFGGRYACGTFWEPPTLLHVARGLSGRHPIRYRCQPEVTRLILYSTADNWAKATDSA